MEVGGEGAHQPDDVLGPGVGQQLVELGARRRLLGLVAIPGLFRGEPRELADALDQVEQLLALLADEAASQLHAETTDVRPQRGVHGRELGVVHDGVGIGHGRLPGARRRHGRRAGTTADRRDAAPTTSTAGRGRGAQPFRDPAIRPPMK